MLERFCSRPLFRTLDIAASRFVVSRECGLNIDGVQYQRGDLVPQGSLTADVIRQLYEPPLRRVELVEYAAVQIPDLYEICKQKGIPAVEEQEEDGAYASFVQAEDSEVEEEESPELAIPGPDSFSRSDLVRLCLKHKFRTDGNKQMLYARVASILARSVDSRKRPVAL